MRIRTRNLVLDSISVPSISVPKTEYWCNGSVVNGSNSFASLQRNTHYVDETIADEVGRGKSNNVIHNRGEYKLNSLPQSYFFDEVGSNQPGYTLLPTASTLYWFGRSSSVIDPLRWLYYPPDNQAVPPRWTLDTSQISETSLQNEVFERAKQLKADAALNLVEANQLWPSLTSLTSSLGIMSRDWKAIRKAIRNLPGSYLAYKFGISPVLSDMMSIYRFWPAMASDLKRYISGDAMRFSVFAEVPCSFNASPTTLHVAREGRFNGTVLKTPIIRYVLTVKPNTAYFTPFFQKASYVMSRFASSPASLAWETIPFSFVLDWFVDMRGALSSLDYALGQSPFTVVGFTRSLTYSLRTDGYMEHTNRCNSSTRLNWHCGSAVYKYYTRRTVVPYGNPIPTWKPRFGKNQAGISAALILQKLMSLKSKR